MKGLGVGNVPKLVLVSLASLFYCGLGNPCIADNKAKNKDIFTQTDLNSVTLKVITKTSKHNFEKSMFKPNAKTQFMLKIRHKKHCYTIIENCSELISFFEQKHEEGSLYLWCKKIFDWTGDYFGLGDSQSTHKFVKELGAIASLFCQGEEIEKLFAYLKRDFLIKKIPQNISQSFEFFLNSSSEYFIVVFMKIPKQKI